MLFFEWWHSNIATIRHLNQRSNPNFKKNEPFKKIRQYIDIRPKNAAASGRKRKG